MFASRDLELGRQAAGLETWRRRGTEAWRCAAGVLPLFALRDLELRRHAAGHGDVEARRGVEI